MPPKKKEKFIISDGKTRKCNLTIGERLKDARVDFNKNKKQTIQEVSDATGIPKSTISEIENDKREPGAGIIRKLAEYYGVSSDFLLGLSDIKTTDTTVQSIIEYTGLSEDNVDFLHVRKENRKEYLVLEAENGIVTIDANMPYLDLLNDLIRIVFTKEMIQYYVVLQQNTSKCFAEGNYYEFNILGNDRKMFDNDMAEYACLKIANEVGKALLHKYHKERE